MSIGFLIAYSFKAALNNFTLGNFIFFFNTTFLMSLLALNFTYSGTCSSSNPFMLTSSSSRAGLAHSGSAWNALLNSGAMWAALLDFRAILGVEPCGAKF